MTANNYQTIFELGFRSFPWIRLVQPSIFLIAGLLFIRFFKNKKGLFVMGILLTSVSSIILVTSLLVFIPDFVQLRAAYVSGKSAVVEGVVQDFRPAPTIGPAEESFSVHGILFSYNALDNECFHNAPFRKGPIREGLNIRIHYNENCIQRVEVLQ